MAESAGQITASLTLDISKFQQAIKQAQGALDKMSGTGGAKRNGGPLGGAKQANENKKIAASLRMVSTSYSALNRAVAAGAIDAKKASAQYSNLTKKLQALEPQVKNDQLAINALNSAMAASAGAEIFRKNQDDARMAAENMANSIGKSSSKIGSFFKVMGAGVASGSRGIVMSVTNITEAFQKGQMGGRMLSTFLLGDLMDAFMIGTFVADGFRKAAASLGPAMAAQATMMRTLAGVFPWVAMGLSALAAAIGYFVSQSDDAKSAADRQTKSFMELANSSSVVAGSIEILSNNFHDLTESINSAATINLDKVLDPVDALHDAVNELDKMEMTGTQIAAVQMANFFNTAFDEAKRLVVQVNRLNAALSGSAAESRKLTKSIAERAAKLQALESAGASEPMQEKLRAEIEQLSKRRIILDRQRALDSEQLENEKTQLRLLKEDFQQSIKARKEYNKIMKVLEAKRDAKKKKKKTGVEKEKKDPALKFFIDSMKEAVKESEGLQSHIDQLYKIIEKAPKGEQAGLLKSLGVKDAEAQIKKIEKRMGKLTSEAFFIDPETGLMLRDMKHAAELQQKAKQDARIQAEQYEKMKKAMEIAAKASGLGINVTSQQVLDMDASQKKDLEQRTSRREQVFSALKDLGLSSDVATKALKEMSFKISDVMVAMAQFADDLVSGIGDMTSGNFGQVFAMTGKGVGTAIGAKFGAADMGGKIGEAAGAFSDMMVGKIEVKTNVVDLDGNAVNVNMGELLAFEFNDQLKQGVDAFKPLADVAFHLASNLGGLLAMLSNAFAPLIDMVANVLNMVFNVIFMIFATLGPAFAFVTGALLMLSPVVEAAANFVHGLISAVFGLVTMVLSAVSAIASMAIQLLTVVPVLEIFATLLNGFSEGFIILADAFGHAAVAIGEFVRWVGQATMNEGLANMGQDLMDLAGDFLQGLDRELGPFGRELQESADLMAESNEQRSKANKEASKVLNAPKGFKIEKYRYEAMNREGMTNPYTGAPLNQNNVNIYGAVTVIADSPEDFMTRMQNNANRVGSINPQFGG